MGPRPKSTGSHGAIVDAHAIHVVATLGFLFNALAGFLNAVTFVEFGRGTMHVSGLSSTIAVNVILADYALLRNILQLLCFWAGAFSSTVVVGGHKKFYGGKHCSVVLCCIAAVVTVAALFRDFPSIATALIAYAAGMQNGMTSFWSGAIMRTTHITGTVTDLGIEAANVFLGRQESTWKLELMASFYLGFLLGGIIGAALAVYWSSLCLLLPATVYLVLAIWNLIHYSRPASHPSAVGPPPTLAELSGKRVTIAGMKDAQMNGQIGIVSMDVSSECCVALDDGRVIHIPNSIAPTRLRLIGGIKVNGRIDLPRRKVTIESQELAEEMACFREDDLEGALDGILDPLAEDNDDPQELEFTAALPQETVNDAVVVASSETKV